MNYVFFCFSQITFFFLKMESFIKRENMKIISHFNTNILGFEKKISFSTQNKNIKLNSIKINYQQIR